MCRLFERILADNINYHLYQNHLITYAQCGFVKGRSTELQLLNYSSLWVKAIDSEQFVDTVYIDFSKAFHTVHHHTLLYKLPKCGICGYILQWFTSFLSDRKQRVKLGKTFSGYTDVSSGVRQGSCTGPPLFILYVNDLPDECVCLFADGTQLSTVLSDVSERPNMQKCLNERVVWADRWKLQVAEHKCCVLKYYPH